MTITTAFDISQIVTCVINRESNGVVTEISIRPGPCACYGVTWHDKVVRWHYEFELMAAPQEAPKITGFLAEA